MLDKHYRSKLLLLLYILWQFFISNHVTRVNKSTQTHRNQGAYHIGIRVYAHHFIYWYMIVSWLSDFSTNVEPTFCAIYSWIYATYQLFFTFYSISIIHLHGQWTLTDGVNWSCAQWRRRSWDNPRHSRGLIQRFSALLTSTVSTQPWLPRHDFD